MAPRRPENASNAPASRKPKPWTPPTTQKTNLERSIGHIGALVPEDLKHKIDESTSRERRLLFNGPDAAPVLDRLGYSVSSSKVAKASRPPRRRRRGAAATKGAGESKRIAELMGVPWEKCSAMSLSYSSDQVARDLDIPYHTVGMAEFEEWSRRGFTMDPRLWQERPSEEEEERLFALAAGSAFRE